MKAILSTCYTNDESALQYSKEIEWCSEVIPFEGLTVDDKGLGFKLDSPRLSTEGHWILHGYFMLDLMSESGPYPYDLEWPPAATRGWTIRISPRQKDTTQTTTPP